uniref:Variant surface glycoprotein 1125.371 n=1 Tax=Trypanosoma brucei TaxID=5691 RepID=A0A1J0R5R6_9TRYP|nr:variant surface glycoprotein 1125.371 [Trypanosoma brucei]
MPSELTRAFLALTSLIVNTEAANENARQYAALCAAYQAATTPINKKMYTGEISNPATPADVKALYAATIPDKLYENTTYGLFTTEAEFTAIKKKVKESKDEHGHDVYSRPTDSPSKQRTHKALERLYNKTTELIGSITLKKKAIEDLTTEAQEELNVAITGNKETKNIAQDQFDSRQNACGEAQNNIAGKQTIPQALACICSANADQNGLCTKGLNTNNYGGQTSAGSTAYAAWTAIGGHCKPGEENSQVTPGQLTAAVTQFRSVLGTHAFTGTGGQYVLGGTSGANCYGTGSATSCIDYTKTVGSGTIGKIQWVKSLLAAAEKLTSAAATKAELTALEAELRSSASAAWKLMDTLDIITATKAELSAQKATALAPKINKEEDCNKQQSSDKCKEPCTWDESEANKAKKCKLDPKKAAEQTSQTETGDGAAATTTEKCKGKKKDECKSPDCKWEGETCKDSPILVNKQFALSLVSAAFVALLF